METAKAIHVANKSSAYKGHMMKWQEVTLASGTKVACVDNKLMSKDIAVQLMNMSNSTYTFTAICERRGTVIDFADVHIPKAR